MQRGVAERAGRLRGLFRELYHKQTPRAVRFRYAVIVIDLLIIGFFIVAPWVRAASPLAFLLIDYLVAFLLAADLAARAMAYGRLADWLKRPIVWVDAFVLLTLLAPMWFFSLGFLRVVRLWTLFHSNFFWETVGRRYDETRWEDVFKTAATLVTFIFIVTGFVYTSFVGRAEGLATYLDALYFTVSTLTTTGFGDVTLPGTWGKLLSIVIMTTGITLFVRLAQALIRPAKVRFPCPQCGLVRHDPDAVHCKACGLLLNIPNED